MSFFLSFTSFIFFYYALCRVFIQRLKDLGEAGCSAPAAVPLMQNVFEFRSGIDRSRKCEARGVIRVRIRALFFWPPTAAFAAALLFRLRPCRREKIYT